MDFHPTAYYKCPSCGMIVSYMAASSMNNFGSTLYSDGYESGMMFFHYQYLVKCSNRTRQGKPLFVHKTDEKLYKKNCLELIRLYDREI